MLEGLLLPILILAGPGAWSGWVPPRPELPSRGAPVLSVPPPGDTLDVEVTTLPGTLRTGDVFLLRIRIRPPDGSPPGWAPDAPDSLPVAGGLEPRGSAALTRPAGEGSDPAGWVLEYPLQALRPGLLPLPPLVLRSGGASGSGPAWTSLPLGSVRIHPHLPGAGGEAETRPPLPAPPPPWTGAGLLLSLSLGGAAAAGVGWVALRRGAPAPLGRRAPALATREGAEQAREALRMLGETLGGRALAEREAREVAGAIASAVRTILEHELGEALQGLSTVEILERLRGPGDGGDGVGDILRAADRLRFGAPWEGPGEPAALFRGVAEWLEARRA